MNTSSLSLATSMPTKESESFMETSLSCECELTESAAARGRPSLKRLFGLVPRRRRRSSFVTALEGLGTIDLASPARGTGAPLRFAPSPRALLIGPEVGMFWNIQDTKTRRRASFTAQLHLPALEK